MRLIWDGRERLDGVRCVERGASLQVCSLEGVLWRFVEKDQV